MPLHPGNPFPMIVLSAILGAYGLANIATGVILILLYLLKELGLIAI